MSKVLVIDDDETILANVAEMLDTAGFEVISAAHGRAGMQLARQHHPDLIICDVLMPELDGYGVLTELQRDEATEVPPFIFLTARISETDRRRGMDLGADDYLTKPFTRDQLLGSVSARLAKHAAAKQTLQARLDELRGGIALAVPHELRTPLSPILAFSEILLEDWASMPREEIRDIMRGIHDSAERLKDVVEDFLQYAELEIAVRDPARALAVVGAGRCQVAQAVAKAVAEMANRPTQYALRGDDMAVEVEDAVVQMSLANLGKIVTELVDNAFKFSKAGTPVRIAGDRTDQVYTLTIQDHGRGMTADQIANVGAGLQFERAYYEQQGTGLGLIIARRLAELHGGELRIESVPGEQTIVRVALPA